MAKFFGPVGYTTTSETTPGVWAETAIERNYAGDILRDTIQRQETDKVNRDLDVTNRISIVADPFAYEHVSAIRYVKWMGAVWNVNSIEIRRPRLILSLGGVYNGPTS